MRCPLSVFALAALLGVAGPSAGQCGDPGAGDCCSANGTPGCDDRDCCTAVCSVDPYCCAWVWDAICADLAMDSCPDCPSGPPPANDDCGAALAVAGGATNFSTVNATTDGPDYACASSLCGGDFRIHNDVWFDWTATFTGVATIRSCAEADFDSKVTVYEGCDCDFSGWVECNDDDPACASGGFSATFQVTSGQCYRFRVGSATGETGTGTFTIEPSATPCPGEGDCCVANGSPGCDDFDCCNAVCPVDPFCCDVSWDSICADEAQVLCNCGAVDCACDLIADGDCCAANGTPTCEAPGCCSEVCETDPSCCNNGWDGLCVELAQHFCPDVCPLVPSGDLDGDGVVGTADFLALLAAWGPCPDPPQPCPADLDGDGSVGTTDFLALLANWGPVD